MVQITGQQLNLQLKSLQNQHNILNKGQFNQPVMDSSDFYILIS